MMLRVHILSKKLTYIKSKIVLCSLQDIHEFLDLSPQLPTLPIAQNCLINHTFYLMEVLIIIDTTVCDVSESLES